MSAAAPRRAAVFDLDGTLVDSVPDLAAALNRTLAEAGLPAQAPDVVARMVGHGVARLVERGFAAAGAPLDMAALPRWVERFLHFYAADLSTRTRPYPGADEALGALGMRPRVVAERGPMREQKAGRHAGTVLQP